MRGDYGPKKEILLAVEFEQRRMEPEGQVLGRWDEADEGPCSLVGAEVLVDFRYGRIADVSPDGAGMELEEDKRDGQE